MHWNWKNGQNQYGEVSHEKEMNDQKDRLVKIRKTLSRLTINYHNQYIPKGCSMLFV